MSGVWVSEKQTKKAEVEKRSMGGEEQKMKPTGFANRWDVGGWSWWE